MTIPPGTENADELYQPIAGVAATYGDPDNKYANFLANADPRYPAAPYFLWFQPFSDSGLPAARPGLSQKRDSSASKSALGGTATLSVILSAVLGFVAWWG